VTKRPTRIIIRGRHRRVALALYFDAAYESRLVHRQGESELRKGQTPAKLRQPEERRKKETRVGLRGAVTSRPGATLNRESFISVNCRSYAERRIVLTETSPFEGTELPLLVTRTVRHSPLPPPSPLRRARIAGVISG